MNCLPTSCLPTCRCEPCLESCFKSAEKADKEIYRCVYRSLFCTGLIALGVGIFGFATLAKRVSAEPALLAFGGSLLSVVTFCGWYCLFANEASRVDRETNRAINKATKGVEANTEEMKKVGEELHQVDEKVTELSSTMQKRTEAVEGLRSQAEATTKVLIQTAENQEVRLEEIKEVTQKIGEQNQDLKQNVANVQQILTQLPVPSEKSEGFKEASMKADQLESRFGKKSENKQE